MNLIICMTPLQMLIAKKIIKKYKNEKFQFLLVSNVKNEKLSYYFNDLRTCCEYSYWMMDVSRKPIDILKFIFFYIKMTFSLNMKYKKVFFANINSSFIHLLLSKIKYDEIYTFDDGTANLIDNGFPVSTSKFYYFFSKLLCVKMGTSEIINKIKKHYSIFPGMKNISDNVEIITLNESNPEHYIKSEKITIFLGQNIFTESNKNVELINKIINGFDIQYYFPHPREEYVIDNVQYINTNLIFEDYFYKYLSSKSCVIYTFFSSAALNVINNNVEVRVLKIKKTSVIYSKCYEIFDKFKNVKTIDI